MLNITPIRVCLCCCYLSVYQSPFVSMDHADWNTCHRLYCTAVKAYCTTHKNLMMQKNN